MSQYQDTQDPAAYMSVKNFQRVFIAFKNYMQLEHDVPIMQDDEDTVKRTLYGVMASIKNSSGPAETQDDLRRLNNQTLKSMRDVYMQKLNVTQDKKPRMRSLNRDQEVYGKREVSYDQLKPEITTNSNRPDVNAQFDALMNSRKPQTQNAPDVSQLPFEVVKDDKLADDEMTMKLKSFETARLNTSIEISGMHKIENSDPKALFQSFNDDITRRNQDANAITSTTNSALDESFNTFITTQPKQASTHLNQLSQQQDKNRDARSKTLINPKDLATMLFTKYVLLNGFDRRWDTYPRRYAFTLDTDDLNNPFKNVSELSFTKLIIPLESPRPNNTTSITQSGLDSLGNPVYYNRYGLTFPYLVLAVDEINNMYEGLNNTARRCTTTFVYDKSYTAENGRGYVVMQPAQEEKRLFHPTPLGALPKLTLSIMRPNGMLYNMSVDDNSALSVSYMPIDANKLYLRIQTKQYFDKNDLNVGDVVVFRDFKLPPPEVFIQRVLTATGASPSQQDVDKYSRGISQVTRFLNRPEGHEVQALGTASTTTTLTKEFAIFIPRVLNKFSGAYEVDTEFADTLMAYQGNTPTNASNTYFTKIDLDGESPILNMSLQITLAATIKITAADAKPMLISALE